VTVISAGGLGTAARVPSRDEAPTGDGWRIRFERTLRAVAVALVLWAIAVTALPTLDGVARVRSEQDLRNALIEWTTRERPLDVRLEMARVPDEASRAWLSALVAEGTRVSWTSQGSAPLPGIALALEPRADPAGRVRMAVAAPTGSRIVLGDDFGSIDTTSARDGGAIIEGPPPAGVVSAVIGSTSARSAVTDSLLYRRLLVVGRVGWESKFLVRALEDEGWRVSVRLALTPRSEVTEDAAVSVDTSQVAAVLVVGEATGISRSALKRYVDAGGGLVLLDGAERSLPLLAVGDSGRSRTTPDAPVDADWQGPPSFVALVPLMSLRPGAVVTARRGGRVAVATLRVGAGRVTQVGYRDSWRWRLEGGDSGSAAHRRWWASRVSDVAYAPAREQRPPIDVDPAPLAAWVDRFGPATPNAPSRATPWRHPSMPWLFAVLLIALLAEWASRRERGAG
jgi:hypothetical protein